MASATEGYGAYSIRWHCFDLFNREHVVSGAECPAECLLHSCPVGRVPGTVRAIEILVHKDTCQVGGLPLRPRLHLALQNPDALYQRGGPMGRSSCASDPT